MQLVEMDMTMLEELKTFSEQKEGENLSICFALCRSFFYFCIFKFPNNQLHMKKHLKTVRTVMASVADIRTYVYGATYDSWNRVRTMTYPDGEVVTYHYNAAGDVDGLSSNKAGRKDVIVSKIGYDKDGHTVYTKLGNGTETTYTYDKERQRLQDMTLSDAGSTLMQNKYKYDAVDNILGITNAADPRSLKNLNSAKLGGASHHTYAYDDMNRLISAAGKAKNADYAMTMTFGRMSEPLTKIQNVDSSLTAKGYNLAYKYEDAEHPTAPTQIGHDHYTYDADGNPTLVVNDSTNTTRQMYWDEDDRLMVLSDNGNTSRYTYDASGNRAMKSSGTMEGVYINGAPQGITFHETDNFTLYPASILTVNKNRFTKHYFIGDKRVVSKIGIGRFNNVYGVNGANVTAGQQDYAARMNEIESQREAYYKQQGIAPGVPTIKGSYGDPENTGTGYNSIVTELGDHSVPNGWIQTPNNNTTAGSNPGAPINWNGTTDPDDPQPGYGYVADDTASTEDVYYYHSDHLGSTSYITDAKGSITQYDAYLPYGELLVDEHSSSEDMPYKFNGKQMDEETGLYYYGARYMNPVASIWYGADPMAEKYKGISPYAYCVNNPVNAFDPDGKLVIFINGMYFNSSEGGTRKYWNGLDTQISDIFHDHHLRYYDGSSGGIFNTIANGVIGGATGVARGVELNSNYNPVSRKHQGYIVGFNQAQSIISSLKSDETIKIVTHSMGGAFSKGFIEGILAYARMKGIELNSIG
jgi:RHS repeat-associated protein